MKKAMLNFWVDVVIGIAFLVLAVSGVVFLLPLGVRGVSASGVATILLVSVPTWHAVHDWSAVIIVIGLGLHCALHYRWIVNMGRRAFGGLPAAAAAPPHPGPLASPEPAAPRQWTGSLPASVTLYKATGVAPGVQDTRSATPVRGPGRSPGAQRRYSRGAFLTGAAGLAGGALLVALIGARGQTPGAANQAGLAALSDGSGASNSNGYGDDYGDAGGDDDYAYGYEDGSSPSDGSVAPGGSAAPNGAVTGASVSVDAACVGCGACLQVCPAGVFAWSGGKAVVADEGACIRCGRCLQACPVGVITVT